MKKADTLASLFAVVIGLISVYLGHMTNVGILAVFILVVIYFYGSSYLFVLILSDEEKTNLVKFGISYNRRFWMSIIVGALASIFLSAFYYFKFKSDLMSSILIGLGLLSILTSFVSSKYNSKPSLGGVDEFG